MALAAGLLAAVAAAAAIVLLNPPRTSQRHTGIQPQTGTQALNGTGFATGYPPGWGLTVKSGQLGFMAYQLSSTHAALDGLGIPPAGAIGITINETPTTALKVLQLTGARPDTAAARQSPVELLPNIVGTPRQAERVTRTESPHPTILAGAPAAEESYTYAYAGRENVQTDILSRHGPAIVLVEFDAEPALAQASQAALETITQQWRWR